MSRGREIDKIEWTARMKDGDRARKTETPRVSLPLSAGYVEVAGDGDGAARRGETARAREWAEWATRRGGGRRR